jgi:hypothetical protein
MIDVASLLELADFTCARCGKPGPVTFEDLAGLEAALTARTPLTSQVRIMEPFGIGHVDPAELARFRPVHRTCPGDRPPAGKPPYRIERSVA